MSPIGGSHSHGVGSRMVTSPQCDRLRAATVKVPMVTWEVGHRVAAPTHTEAVRKTDDLRRRHKVDRMGSEMSARGVNEAMLAGGVSVARFYLWSTDRWCIGLLPFILRGFLLPLRRRITRFVRLHRHRCGERPLTPPVRRVSGGPRHRQNRRDRHLWR